MLTILSLMGVAEELQSGNISPSETRDVVTKHISALRRGLAVLDLLSSASSLSLAELAQQTGMAKATLLRMLVTLEMAGHARRGLGDNRWRAAGRAGPADADGRLAEVSAPVLDGLCQRVLWPSDVGVYRGGAIQVLETLRLLSPFLVNRVVSYGIHVLPSAMGRAILAWTSDQYRKEILRDLCQVRGAHERMAQDPEAVENLVRETRARGYAVRHPGYYVTAAREALVSAIALPVMQGDHAIAAVNLSWVAKAMTEAEVVSSHLEDLRGAVADISDAYSSHPTSRENPV